MVTKRPKLTAREKELLAKDERARLIVQKALANKELMDGVRESIEARARGEKGITLEQLKKEMGEE